MNDVFFHVNLKDKSEALLFTELDLFSVDITQVDPDVVAGAVTKLEKVKLWVTPAQLKSILTKLQFGDSKMKDLSLMDPDLCAVTTEVLIGAIRMVETVETVAALFTADQVTAILVMLTEGSRGRLKKLSILWPNVGEEAYGLLGAAEGNDILEIVLP